MVRTERGAVSVEPIGVPTLPQIRNSDVPTYEALVRMVNKLNEIVASLKSLEARVTDLE